MSNRSTIVYLLTSAEAQRGEGVAHEFPKTPPKHCYLLHEVGQAEAARTTAYMSPPALGAQDYSTARSVIASLLGFRGSGLRNQRAE